MILLPAVAYWYPIVIFYYSYIFCLLLCSNCSIILFRWYCVACYQLYLDCFVISFNWYSFSYHLSRWNCPIVFHGEYYVLYCLSCLLLFVTLFCWYCILSLICFAQITLLSYSIRATFSHLFLLLKLLCNSILLVLRFFYLPHFNYFIVLFCRLFPLVPLFLFIHSISVALLPFSIYLTFFSLFFLSNIITQSKWKTAKH